MLVLCHKHGHARATMDGGATTATGAAAAAGGGGATDHTATTGAGGGVPLDAVMVESLLRSMGVTSWEPQVVPQLVEVYHRHVAKTLDVAQRVATHAASHTKGTVEDERRALVPEDVLVAQRMEPLMATHATSLPRHAAAEPRAVDAFYRVNERPLPEMPRAAAGVRLPPSKHQITDDNVEFVPQPKQARISGAGAGTGAGAGAAAGVGADASTGSRGYSALASGAAFAGMSLRAPPGKSPVLRGRASGRRGGGGAAPDDVDMEPLGL